MGSLEGVDPFRVDLGWKTLCSYGKSCSYAELQHSMEEDVLTIDFNCVLPGWTALCVYIEYYHRYGYNLSCIHIYEYYPPSEL